MAAQSTEKISARLQSACETYVCFQTETSDVVMTSEVFVLSGHVQLKSISLGFTVWWYLSLVRLVGSREFD